MTLRKVTDARAREIILSQCRQFIEDTPWDEPGHVWDARVERLAKHLDVETGAEIHEKATGALRELLTTLEEIQSAEAGTHWRIMKNHALTIDNTPDLKDELSNKQLPDHLTALISESGFLPAKQVAA